VGEIIFEKSDFGLIICLPIVPVRASKKCVNVKLRIFAQGLSSQNAQTFAALVLTDLSTPHSAVIPHCDVTRTSHNLKKRIVSLSPGRTDPWISLQSN